MKLEKTDVRHLPDNEAEPDEGASKFPVAKSVRGKVAVIVGFF